MTEDQEKKSWLKRRGEAAGRYQAAKIHFDMGAPPKPTMALLRRLQERYQVAHVRHSQVAARGPSPAEDGVHVPAAYGVFSCGARFH